MSSWERDLAIVAIGSLIGLGIALVAIKMLSSKSQGGSQQQAFVLGSSIQPQAVMTNREDILWTDWRGRSRRITIHREVH